MEEALHLELCTAIADLAKSVDVAVTRIALRSKCTAAIADAAKVERAAEALRAAALDAENSRTAEVTLVPGIPAIEGAADGQNLPSPPGRHRLHPLCRCPTVNDCRGAHTSFWSQLRPMVSKPSPLQPFGRL